VANFLGSLVGIYLIYALFAAIFKHKAGFIILCVLGIGSGITNLAILGDFRQLLAAIIAIPIIALIPKIQIRKKKL